MAISSSLLSHTVTLRKQTQVSRERQKTYTEYELSAVRVVPTVAKKDSASGAISSDSATLFVDATYSYVTAAASDDVANSESTTEDDALDGAESSVAAAVSLGITTGDEVVFEGRVWQVQSVKTVHKGAGDVHHLEVALV